MDQSVTLVSTNKARKRNRDPSKWKKNILKRQRFAAKGLPEYPSCGHSTKSFRCSTLKMVDVKKFHESFYSSENKVSQNAFILKHCTVQACKRRRPKNYSHEPKTTAIKCYVKTSSGEIPVCQEAFRNILGITKHRIAFIMKNYANSATLPVEKRGGDKRSLKFTEKRESIQEFLSQFQCVEAHYCRSVTTRRYLSSELNIKKLFRMYKESGLDSQGVKESYFRYIFNTRYNLSFGTPRTDVCSTCLQYSEKIKRTDDVEQKQTLIAEEKVHKARANAFFQLLQEKRNDLITLSFDCQKNLVLPKIPDQSVYYSRQLYLYNFAIVQGCSKSKLNQNSVFSYYWTENEYKKGSNEICSAVYDRLKKTNIGRQTRVLRLIADGCSGQNKNTVMIGMCCKWLSEDAPKNIDCIELVFPITGHSFLPADRVFAQIEKKVRKIEVLTKPSQYVDIISESGSVFHLGKDCGVHDWKEAVSEHLTSTASWNFGFRQAKRFYLTRSRSGNVLLRGEPHYRNDLNTEKNVFKKGKTPKTIRPTLINRCNNPISILKINDVKKLLEKHFGENWRELEELAFYNEVIVEATVITDPQETNNDDTNCEFVEELPALLI